MNANKTNIYVIIALNHLTWIYAILINIQLTLCFYHCKHYIFELCFNWSLFLATVVSPLHSTTHMTHNFIYTVSQKKFPPFSVTLSNLNIFSKILHCWKAYEICYKTHTNPTHLRHVDRLALEIKNSNFLQIYTRYEKMKENANDLHVKCTDFNSCMRVTVWLLSVFLFLSKSCPHPWIPCRLRNTAVMSAVTNFQCHKLIVKVNQ